MIGQYLKIWNLRVQINLNIEKITFKVVQMKFLAMHITNQKLSFDIFTVGNLQNIFMEHDLNILMIFGIKEKCIILTHTMYCCLLLQIYLCYLWLLLCSRVIYIKSDDIRRLESHITSVIILHLSWFWNSLYCMMHDRDKGDCILMVKQHWTVVVWRRSACRYFRDSKLWANGFGRTWESQ